MARPTDMTVIRSPRWYRISAAVSGIFYVLAGLVAGTVGIGSGGGVILVIMAGPVYLMVRNYRVSLEVHEDRLLVRNVLTTREIHREDITGFHLGPSPWHGPGPLAVHVLRGSAPAVVASATVRFPLLAGRYDQLERWRDELQSWKSL